jgi:DNA-binding transcriptional regulator GbsR (MarR family)
MRTKKSDLLTEINIMRSMMGLKENSMLITENIIVGLAKAFGKTAARHADDIVKVMDDFISTSAAGGSVAAQRTMATRLKGLLDDLDNAVKAVDDVGIKTAMKSILNDVDFGVSAANKIADDMFAPGDEITIALNNRVKSMRAQGYADDVIKQQLKMDVGDYLKDFPDTLKNAAKVKVDTAIDFSGKVITKNTDEILNNIYTKLDNSEVWNKLKKDEILFIQTKKYLKNLVEAGAKSEDEIYEQMIKRADKLMKEGFRKKYRAFFENLSPKYGNQIRMIVNAMFILLITGGIKAWGPRVKTLFAQLFESDVDVLKQANELVDESGNEEDKNKPAGNCDKTETDFRTYLKNERKYTDLDTNTAYGAIVWDQKTCSGSIMDGDVQFTYNMDTKTWS